MTQSPQTDEYLVYPENAGGVKQVEPVSVAEYWEDNDGSMWCRDVAGEFGAPGELHKLDASTGMWNLVQTTAEETGSESTTTAAQVETVRPPTSTAVTARADIMPVRLHEPGGDAKLGETSNTETSETAPNASAVQSHPSLKPPRIGESHGDVRPGQALASSGVGSLQRAQSKVRTAVFSMVPSY